MGPSSKTGIVVEILTLLVKRNVHEMRKKYQNIFCRVEVIHNKYQHIFIMGRLLNFFCEIFAGRS
jgi:hypothetical protein